MKISISAATLVCTVVMVAVPSLLRGDATFSDGTFNDSNWTVTSIQSGGFGGVVDFAGQVASGGNPGSYRRIDLTVNSGNSAIFGISLFTASVYNPQTQGAISAIDYSEDGIALTAQSQSAGFCLFQEGTVFFANALSYLPSSTWSTHSITGQTQLDFSDVDGVGTPDFSATGAPITFGFWRETSAGGGNGFSSSTGIDNWSVTIHSVPEPATLTLITIGAFGLVVARGRNDRGIGRTGRSRALKLARQRRRS